MSKIMRLSTLLQLALRSLVLRHLVAFIPCKKMFSSPRFPCDSTSSNELSPSIQDGSFETLKKWIMATYGDGSKTKTITWSKYLRIHKVLSGRSLGESPKFKFWVKTKGFTFLQCPKMSGRPSELSGWIIALPNRKTSVERVYKRVAVVEEFFDIIYDIHVNMESQNGKHAGQKRTYRTIIESYAFLPREAVTHFLMSCKDCRSRMHLTPSKGFLSWDNKAQSFNGSPLSTGMLIPERHSSPTPSEISIDVESDSHKVQIPLTLLTGAKNDKVIIKQFDPSIMSLADVNVSAVDQTAVDETKSPLLATMTNNGQTQAAGVVDSTDAVVTPAPAAEIPTLSADEILKAGSNIKSEYITPGEIAITTESEDEPPKKCIKREKAILPDATPIVPALMSSPLKRTADSSMNLSPTVSKKSRSSDDADDEDDEDDDEKSLSSTGPDNDPERLKAFNMFCRLFVDENLDRLVPISKQPKEKVQQILDACDRQFPDFHDRSRKRIRTYLKSCRRMRRAREMNGHENSRPTPPHLTSPLAESLLDQACKNEQENIKRIRMGMDPIAILPPMKQATANMPTHSKSHVPSPGPGAPISSMPSLVPGNIGQVSAQATAAHRAFHDWRFQQSAPFRQDIAPFFTNGFFRPPFPGFHTPLPAAALQASQVAAAANQLALHNPQVNASPDLCAMKKQAASLLSAAAPNKASSLSSVEMTKIGQLISGYREAATFLYRSADELEQLISSGN